MLTTYNLALKKLLEHEGGFTNHPSDPGGPTNFGITIYDARKYLNHQLDNSPPWDDESIEYMREMTVGQAKQIYKPKYWDAQSLDQVPAGLDYFLFDYGVNSGIGRSAKVIQRIVHVTADGKIGPITLQAIAQHDVRSLIRSISQERLDFLHGLKTWPVFGKGWGRRVNEVTDLSIQLASGLTAASPVPFEPAPFRAMDGERAHGVRLLQSHMTITNDYDGALDGDDGPKTLLAFQKFKGNNDSIIRPETIREFEKALAA
jgi:lysozyme family protein